MRRCLVISAVFAALFLFIPAQGKKRDSRGIYLETKVDRNRTVEGERLIYEVVLYSSTPDVAGCEVCVNPAFKGLSVTRSAPDSRLEQVGEEDTPAYRAVIDRFFIGTDIRGSYTVKGGEYRIAVNNPVEVDDPFWGRGIANDITTAELKAPDLRIKVDPLPEKGRPVSFSGAVGHYEVEISSAGRVTAGEEAVMLVTVSGQGDLTSASLPELPKYLGEGLQFRSMTDSRSHFIKNGSLGSEIEIECVFTAAKPGKYTAGPVEFTYFDTETGEYMTVSSDAIEIEVEDGVPAGDAPPEIYDV